MSAPGRRGPAPRRRAARTAAERVEYARAHGFHLTPFWSPTDRAPTAIIDEAIEVVHAGGGHGLRVGPIGHHTLCIRPSGRIRSRC